jgi:hypothetical protein
MAELSVNHDLFKYMCHCMIVSKHEQQTCIHRRIQVVHNFDSSPL